MTSFLPFSSSSTSRTSNVLLSDDAHLEVTVTPSSSAYYAGETFSATISFRNTRTPLNAPTTGLTSSTSSALHHGSPHAHPYIPEDELGSRIVSAVRPIPNISSRTEYDIELPERQQQIGLHLASRNVRDEQSEAGPSRPRGLDLSPSPLLEPRRADLPYSPGANPSSRAEWPINGNGDGPTIRSPDQWALSNGKPGHSRRTRSLALGKGQLSPQQMVWALAGQGPPPLPRRPPGRNHIPSQHPHSRKESIGSLPAPSPSSGPIGLPDIDQTSDRPSTTPYLESDQRRAASLVSSSSSLPTPDESSEDLPQVIDLTPSYSNAYGASLLRPGHTPPPPSHPLTRNKEPRTTTILWAYTQFKASFHPSNAYIPPDPLLPLRSLMLHQPVGSGSLLPQSDTLDAKSSRWQFSFGTGSIGDSIQPSLTGSLFGLAKTVMSGGSGGSLEEERRRVWNMKDLPVFQTPRSLIGVDLKLKEGEAKEFTYTLRLPKDLPPSYRGRAFRFAFELVVSVTVALPGGGRRQKSAEVQVPIRVWSNVSISDSPPTYDVLRPTMHTKNEAVVSESTGTAFARVSMGPPVPTCDTESSLQSYAQHLSDNIDQATKSQERSPRLAIVSPSKNLRTSILSPSSPDLALPAVTSHSTSPETLSVPLEDDGRSGSFRHRSNSFIEGDDELVEEGIKEGACGEAVEILSRHSAKSSYDIAKDGESVAVLTLTKTVFRLGESVLGVVTFNDYQNDRHVLKLSAFLESNEIIPETLFPHGQTRQPRLDRLHAEHRTGYAVFASRLAFSLNIPSDVTPGFSLAAGPEGEKGGLGWRIRLAMLVTVPRRRHRQSLDRNARPGDAVESAKYLLAVPSARDDGDNTVYTALTSLAPVMPSHRKVREQESGGKMVSEIEEWREMDTETIECQVPIRVLAGNTAFLVRPTIQVV